MTAASVVESPVIFSGDNVLSSSTVVYCLRSCRTFDPVLFDGVLTAYTLGRFRRLVGARRTDARTQPLTHVDDMARDIEPVVQNASRLQNLTRLDERRDVVPRFAWRDAETFADADEQDRNSMRTVLRLMVLMACCSRLRVGMTGTRCPGWIAIPR